MEPKLAQHFFEIAAKSPCDIKTARNYFDPARRARMKPSVRARVSTAVRACGFEDPGAAEEKAA